MLKRIHHTTSDPAWLDLQTQNSGSGAPQSDGYQERQHGRASEQSLYLRSDAGPVFAVAHVPPAGKRRTTGVVMCPSFGWEDLCTHRTKRTWAQALADAGHATIRIDLPGTGDSAGSARDPERVAAWLSAVTAAATWLRLEAGCGRVAGFGIGFGGMLAWLAAAEGAPVDDLMLWAASTTGKRMLREMRAAARMTIDPRIDPESAEDVQVCADATAIGDDLLDEAGQITTRATIEQLTPLDLTTMALPDAAGRRVLVFMRDDNEADRAVRAFFADAGVEVTDADGSGYGAMMQYVQDSRVPVEAVAQSVAWLGAVPEPGAPADASSVAQDDARNSLTVDALEIVQDGVAIVERPISLRVGPAELSGIVTEPVGTSQAALCAVFFSGGSDRRIGPNRMWVETSRRWAAKGVHCVRIDPPGIGDTEGDEQFWEDISMHYGSALTGWTVGLLDALQAEGLPNRFVLTGFCAGAYRSIQVALIDDRIAGAFAIGPFFFFWNWWTVKVRDWWTVDWVGTSHDPLKKRVAIGAIQRTISVLHHVRRAVSRVLQRGPDRSERALRQLSDQGTEVLVLFKSVSHELRDLRASGRINRLRALPHVELLQIPGGDTRFRPLVLQHYINGAMDAALERVLANNESGEPVPVGPLGSHQQA
jgi:pimeloyl-ACP methyl ester carboxylesterase